MSAVYLATLKQVNIEIRIIVKMGRVGWMCKTALSDILAMIGGPYFVKGLKNS